MKNYTIETKFTLIYILNILKKDKACDIYYFEKKNLYLNDKIRF